MTTNRPAPLVRPAPAAAITATRTLDSVYQPAEDAVVLSSLAGRWLHLYGLETFQSDQYGLGVRLNVREADANGAEITEEFTVVTFAYRVKAMAAGVLGEATYASWAPPVRVRVREFGTAKGQSYDLVNA